MRARLSLVKRDAKVLMKASEIAHKLKKDIRRKMVVKRYRLT